MLEWKFWIDRNGVWNEFHNYCKRVKDPIDKHVQIPFFFLFLCFSETEVRNFWLKFLNRPKHFVWRLNRNAVWKEIHNYGRRATDPIDKDNQIPNCGLYRTKVCKFRLFSSLTIATIDYKYNCSYTLTTPPNPLVKLTNKVGKKKKSTVLAGASLHVLSWHSTQIGYKILLFVSYAWHTVLEAYFGWGKNDICP